MYNYTSGTLSIRAKCSLSYYHLSLPNDQPHCCHSPWCHYSASGFFPVNPRFVSGYLLGQSFAAPSIALLRGHRRLTRVFSRSDDFEMMGLLAEPEERFLSLEDVRWKSGRKEVEVKSVERRGSRKGGKVASCLLRSNRSSSVASPSSTLLHNSDLNEAGRRRAAGESIARKGTKFGTVEEPGEIHKFGDDSWRRRYSSKRNVVVDSAKDDPMKEHDCFRQVKGKHVDVDLRDNLSQQLNSRENGSHGRSQRTTRTSEVQSDDVKRTLVYANVRKNEKELSSASAARQSSDMNHQVGRRDESRTIQEKQCKIADFHDTNVQNAAYTHRSFQKTTVGKREEETNLEQNSTQVVRDKKVYFDLQALEQDKSTRSSQSLREVSVLHGSNIEKTSDIDVKRLLGMDKRTNSVHDSGQVIGMDRPLMALQRPIESKSDEREEKLAMKENSIQLRRAAGKHIDRRVLEHDEANRSTGNLGELSGVSSSNLQASSLFERRRNVGMESESDFLHSSVSSAKDRGIQVEISQINDDQFEMSRFNASNDINSRSLCSPSDSRYSHQEYNTLLDLDQISSAREQYRQANQEVYIQNSADVGLGRDTTYLDAARSKNGRISNLQGNYNSIVENKNGTSSAKILLQYSSDVESQRDTDEFDIRRSNNRRVSTLHDNNNSIIENKNETSSSKTSVLMTREEEMQNIFITGASSKSASMQIALTGSSDSCRSTIHQIGGVTNDSVTKSDKSSASHVAEPVDKLQKEMVELNELEKTSNVCSGIQIGEPSKRNVQATSAIQVGELNESRRYGDGRYINEGGSLTSSKLVLKGPSDEIWDVQGISSQDASNAEEPEVDFPTSRVSDLTSYTPMGMTATRRPHKSLWSYVTDIIRMSWVLRGHSHGSILESDKRTSSNESLGSETWFSGHEPDEVVPGDEIQNDEKIRLLKDSVQVKESVELLFGERKNGDRLAVTELNSSVSSGLMKNGLSTNSSSPSVVAEHTMDAKLSHGNRSSVDTVEQQVALVADDALPSTANIIESRIRDKMEVLTPSFSFPVAMKKKGFASSIAPGTGMEPSVSAQVWEGNNSGLENFEQPSVSTADSALPRITKIEEGDVSGNVMQKSELTPFSEKPPEMGAIKESEIKRRKFQRNKQVLREQFDEWEEAFKFENEQRKLDEIFMKEAILEARKGADIWEVPVGAVLVQEGKIIARGCNMVEELRDSTAHAEMICIREASNILRTWRLAETTLYVTLEPCPMCAGAILQARIGTVVWGAPNRLLGADGSWVRLFPGGDGESNNMGSPNQLVGPVHPFHPKIKIRRGVLATECSDVMQQFFKLRRKKNKEPVSPPPSCLPISNRPTKFFTKLHNIFSMMFCL